MNHSFNTDIAIKIGVDEAIIIENLAFWIKKNQANNKHFHDNYFWTYNSERAFSELFPYWTRRQIQRILNSLENQGIIISGNYNKSPFDRTKWYTIIDISILQNYKINYSNVANQRFEPNGSTEMAKPFNATTQTVQPIPYINTNINSDIKNTSLSEQNSDEQKSKNNNKIFENDSVEIRLSEYLYKKIKENNPKAKQPNFNPWAKNIDLLLRIDKRTEEEVRKIIDFCQKDSFWRSNILSTSKLRDRFDQLWIKMQEPPKQAYSNGNMVNGKPIQATNYEQREYDDEFFDGLYNNLEY